MSGHNEASVAADKPRVPAWALGLLIAAVIFVAVLLIFSALGFGDDPVVESLSSQIR